MGSTIADPLIQEGSGKKCAPVASGRLPEIKAPLILQPGPAALTDGLDALVAALWDPAPAGGDG